jgi:hypothetical protein
MDKKRGFGREGRTQNTPDEIRRFAFKLKSELAACPAMCAITSNHIFRMYDFRLAFLLFTLIDQVICIVFCEITPEQPIIHRRTLTLRWLRFFFRQMAQLHSDGVIIWRVVVAVVGDVQ